MYALAINNPATSPVGVGTENSSKHTGRATVLLAAPGLALLWRDEQVVDLKVTC